MACNSVAPVSGCGAAPVSGCGGTSGIEALKTDFLKALTENDTEKAADILKKLKSQMKPEDFRNMIEDIKTENPDLTKKLEELMGVQASGSLSNQQNMN
jgi:hypothetical protein